MPGELDQIKLDVSGSSRMELKEKRRWLYHLCSLPLELIDGILSFLRPQDLVSVAATCRQLNRRATADHIWQSLVQDNVPGVRLTSPAPLSSFLELYKAHYPHWFLPRYKIWFDDRPCTGGLIIVRFDPRRGCVEGYRLLAVNEKKTTHDMFKMDRDVVVQHFEPDVKLHLDKPVLQLDAVSIDNFLRTWVSFTRATAALRGGISAGATTVTRESSRNKAWLPSTPDHPDSYVFAETHMRLGHDGTMFGSFMHARTLDLDKPSPGESLPWPSLTVTPDGPRTMTIPRGETLLRSGGRPRHRNELCERAFRLRTWTELGGRPVAMMGMQYIQAHDPARLGEEITTFATIDPAQYTPTPTKPWQGIWVGDYNGHGCEFLLIDQPDEDANHRVGPGEMARLDGETEEDFEKRKWEHKVWRGPLRAVKLTGDVNVPRGAITFIARDLGERGYLSTTQEHPFIGARVVNCRGQIAEENYRNAMWIDSKLIFVSSSRLAHYWMELGHINYYERVDIDRFLKPGQG